MASKPTVTLTFSGDEKKLTEAMSRTVKGAQDMGVSVTKASSEMAAQSGAAASRMGESFKVAGGVMLANFSQAAFSKVTSFFHGMVDEAREAEKVSRSTAQGIATMGAASWITAQQVGDLAEAISNKTGIDDEAIQQSANLLLTFGNVRNAAGEMNNIFDRSVAATQDLAAKGFGDADSAAKMLGKALNDPIKGLTALGKAGVTFSADQTKQIKLMVEHGNLLGAQKILLGEVERQVGGTAEATATAGDKMRTTWANFQEDLGTAVLPMLDNLLGKLSGVIEWAGQHPKIVEAIGAVTLGIWLLNAALNANPIVLITTLVAGLVAALVVLWTQSAGFRQFFIDTWDMIRTKATDAAHWVVDRWNDVVGFFKSIPDKVGMALGTLASVMGNAFRAGVNGLVDALNWFLDHTLNWMIDRANDVIRVVPGVPYIPRVPHVPRMHTGGVVPGPPGTETMVLARAGERVETGAGRSSGGELRVSGSGAVKELIQAMIADGELQLIGR